MPDTSLIILVVVLALTFDFINGFHDTANAIATCVSTRAIRPGVAIVGTAILNFIGAMISTGVAKTIGGDIVMSASMITEVTIVAGLIGAIIWNLVTWWFGMPSSSSHALIGGIIGAVIVSAGISALNGWGILKIVLSLIISPVAAMICGYILMKIVFAICHSYKPARVNLTANRLQVLSAALMAFSHGSNDAQKSMGIITLALLSGGFIGTLEVPDIVKLLCAAAMACGTSVGGWKIIRTVGGKIFKMHPIHGFAADLNSSLVIFSATLMHLPVSTTHVVSGSIMGVGSAERVKAVHWDVARQMVTAWVMTIPCTALMGALSYLVVHTFF
ncbi:inorganic phosphate transporter [uncultured Mitsuokella sp.]|uniref:inorganic phosphate transporter n=1 Tax=uncultured Mitsuokella sp. TaxID=453120 RepID=UPI0025FF6CBF|nr:inorganic phosphate transporter [uncultured Mitsuokella sp.]